MGSATSPARTKWKEPFHFTGRNLNVPVFENTPRVGRKLSHLPFNNCTGLFWVLISGMKSPLNSISNLFASDQGEASPLSWDATPWHCHLIYFYCPGIFFILTQLGNINNQPLRTLNFTFYLTRPSRVVQLLEIEHVATPVFPWSIYVPVSCSVM